jgi:deoxyribose-phosphate aldolase
MQWLEAIQIPLQASQSIQMNKTLLQQLFECLDLTSLNAEDTEDRIRLFAKKAKTSWGEVAAVCVYPSFVRLLATELAPTSIHIATVVNFPQGTDSLASVLTEIQTALKEGAQEIDVVMPYERYLAGDHRYAYSFVEACKAACGKATLKVILETGALKHLDHIAKASECAILAGADFIKTSTGKIAEGASLEAAAVMLLMIQRLTSSLHRRVGIKISGGVKDVQQAAQYRALAQHIMGAEWVNAETFRIGASKLADEIITCFSEIESSSHK